MSISNAAYCSGSYDSTRTMAVTEGASAFAFEIEGFEGKWLLCRQVSWPETAPARVIEVPGPLGMTLWQRLPAITTQQGRISLSETVAGQLDQWMVDVITHSVTTFNARIYEGTPESFRRAKRIVGAAIRLDDPNRDWENRSQPLIFNGMLTFQYHDEVIAGRATPNAATVNMMRAANQQ